MQVRQILLSYSLIFANKIKSKHKPTCLSNISKRKNSMNLIKKINFEGFKLEITNWISDRHTISILIVIRRKSWLVQNSFSLKPRAYSTRSSNIMSFWSRNESGQSQNLRVSDPSQMSIACIEGLPIREGRAIV